MHTLWEAATRHLHHNCTVTILTPNGQATGRITRVFLRADGTHRITLHNGTVIDHPRHQAAP